MVTGDRGHDVYPGSGPLDGGNALLPALLILMNMSITRVDLPRDRDGKNPRSLACMTMIMILGLYGLNPPVYIDIRGD